MIKRQGTAAVGKTAKRYKANQIVLASGQSILFRAVNEGVDDVLDGINAAGSAVIDTGRLSVISSDDGSLTFCRIESPRR